MDTMEERALGSAGVHEAIEEDPKVVKRTAWSFLSSFAIHSASVAAALLLITLLRTPPPPGLSEFETVAFTEDFAVQGGSNDSSTEVSGDELVESEDQVDTDEQKVPESEVDVEKSIDKERSDMLTESEDRVRENDEGVKVNERMSDALTDQMASLAKDKAKKLAAQVAALEKKSAAKVSHSGIKLKKPGVDTDGSGLFSMVGKGEIIFIIDVSGSMGAMLPLEAGGYITALDYVKLEIQGMIRRQLTPAVAFNFISFSSMASAWESKLVAGHPRVKDSAIQYVKALQPGGGTNIHEALRIAFNDPDVKTIFVLSDGAPTVGVTDPTQILKDVRHWNGPREVTVHTLAFIVGGSPRAFLRKLALENGGIPQTFP